MAAILADDNFKCIFLNENYRILIQISLKFVPMSPIDNTPALFQVMAWQRTGDKAIIWTNAEPVNWRIYATLGGDDLTYILYALINLLDTIVSLFNDPV